MAALPRRAAPHAAALVAILSLLLLGHSAAQASSGGGSDAVGAAASAAAASAGQAGGSSACAKSCFDKAKQLGFDRVAGDSMACFMPYKGKRLSTYDCCDKAELLLGAVGSLASCLCCPEFAKAMLSAVPYAKIGTTPEEFLEKLHMCRVPIVGQASCSEAAIGAAKESARVAAAAAPPASAAAPPASAPAPATGPFGGKALLETFNLTGLFPLLGFDTQFSANVLAAQGQAAVAAGDTTQIKVVGGSELFSDYITGFVAWIERETPRYSTPKLPQLPPLPEQYKADVLWVANLRRGAYPDLIKGRPAQLAPAATDPLQNGAISNLPPGEVFGGRQTALNGR